MAAAADPGGSITAYSWTKVSGRGGTITSPSAASTTVTGLAQGTYVFRLTVTDNGSPGLTGSDDVTVTVNGTTTATTYRINAGGPQLSTSLGTFAADNFFSPSPGYTFSTTSAIAGTTDDALYQSERSSTTNQGTFGYAFPVANGSYTVVLHFAEIYWTAVGKRVFDVSIENQKVLDNYDIFKKVGGFTATTETFAVTVSDGTLNINFSAQAIDGGLDRPKVSAIEILSSGAALTTAASSITTNEVSQGALPENGIAYPNPSGDGRFKVSLSKEVEGEVAYSLFTLSGSELKNGKLSLIKPTSVLEFNFSQEMQKNGMYYLQLNNKGKKSVFKLVYIGH